MLSKLLQFLPVILSGAAFLAVGLICFLWSQRALEHSPKQLDWIRQHDRGGYPFLRDAFPSGKADWLGIFGVAVFALIAAMGYRILRCLHDGLSWQTGLFAPIELLTVLLAILGAICMYFLLHRLFASTLISVCGTLLFSACGVGAHSAACILTAALLLLTLWLTSRRETAKPFPTELLYWGAVLLFCAAMSLRPALLPVALLFIGFHLFKLISALRHDSLSGDRFFMLVALGLVIWVLGLGLYAILGLILHGGISLLFLQSFVERYGVIGTLLRLWKNLPSLVLQPILRSRVLLPLMSAPLTGLGCFGLLSGLLLWTRRQDPRPKLILPTALALLIPWVLADVWVLPIALTLGVGLLFHNFLRDRKRVPVICVTVLGVLFSVGFYAACCLLHLGDALVSRLF